MWSADKWEQYRLIDSAEGEKLEGSLEFKI